MEILEKVRTTFLDKTINFLNPIGYPELAAEEMHKKEEEDEEEEYAGIPEVQIEKHYEEAPVKSKVCRTCLPKWFKFDTKDSINLAKVDIRSPLEIFKSIIQKINGVYPREGVDLLCQACQRVYLKYLLQVFLEAFTSSKI